MKRTCHGQQDAGPGTTKHFRIAAAIEEKASRGKTDMFGDKIRGPSGDVLDRIAEEKLNGGYDTRRKNQCPSCFQLKSTNGACSC